MYEIVPDDDKFFYILEEIHENMSSFCTYIFHH